MSGEALTYVEIDIPYCSLTYGIAPCTASLTSSPPTGTQKCFNTLATCQDTANIDLQTVTLRFAVPTAYLPRDIDIVGPWINNVEYSPSVVSLGENLGQRASLKVTFTEHPHSDAGPGLDKYHAERGYDPYLRGTFWGRFKKRYPSIRGFKFRWITGFVGQSLSEMETRHFFCESFDGVTEDGKFSITAKDVLKFLDGDRAQVPALSNGFLLDEIDEDDTAAQLSPAGIGNAEYPASGWVSIGGNEVCAFTRSGDSLTLTRAQRGSVASSHDAQDRVQLCFVRDAQDPANIVADVIEGHTDTPAGYVPRSEWLTETNTNLNRLYSVTITEPTPVNKVVSWFVQHCALAMWDDNIGQKIRLQVLRGIPTDAAQFDESNVIKGSFTKTDQPEKRYTQIWVYYGLVDPTKRIDDPDNYRSSRKVPPDAEVALSPDPPSILKIFANTIPQFGNQIAQTLGEKIRSRYTVAPQKFGLNLLRGSVDAPELGAGYKVSWWTLQDASGAGELVPAQGIRLRPEPWGWHFELEEMRFFASDDDLTVRRITIDFNTFNFNLRTVHDSLYPPLEPGQSVECTIVSGVIVGSTSTALPAFDVGDWDGSPSITLNVLGRIQGKGGNGGKGGPGNTPGQAGGIALFTRQSIDLTDNGGQLWGGGGGGGGGNETGPRPGGGGGGGAGQSPGAGGVGGTVGSFVGNPGTAGTTETGGAGGPPLTTGGAGGNGGGPGLSGTAGADFGSAGGAAGSAIDGISFITTVGAPGDRRGGQIN